MATIIIKNKALKLNKGFLDLEEGEREEAIGDGESERERERVTGLGFFCFNCLLRV